MWIWNWITSALVLLVLHDSNTLSLQSSVCTELCASYESELENEVGKPSLGQMLPTCIYFCGLACQGKHELNLQSAMATFFTVFSCFLYYVFSHLFDVKSPLYLVQIYHTVYERNTETGWRVMFLKLWSLSHRWPVAVSQMVHSNLKEKYNGTGFFQIHITNLKRKINYYC
jgi:hypothetical protein